MSRSLRLTDELIARRLAERSLSPDPGLVADILRGIESQSQRRSSMFGAWSTAWVPLVLALLLALVTGLALITAGNRPDAPWRPPFARWQPARLPTAAAQLPAQVFPSDAVAFHGGYVAVGYAPGSDGWGNLNDVGAIWRSTDGTAWQSVDDPSFAGASIFGVATDGQRLVAVGTLGLSATGEPMLEGAAWLSTDGLSWRLVKGGPAWFAGPITFGLGRFFAEGCSGAGGGPCSIWSSPDGASWVIAASTSSSLPLTLHTTDHGVIAVGGGYRDSGMGLSFVTRDGASWVRSANQDQLANMPLADVTYFDGRYVAIGQYVSSTPRIKPGSYVLTSSDGLTWERGSALGTKMWFSKMLATPSGLIAIGSAFPTANGGTLPPVLMGSLDGTAWEVVPGAEQGLGLSDASVAGWLVRPDGQLLAVGSATQANGTSAPFAWTAAP
jgi:hypothetical protein